MLIALVSKRIANVAHDSMKNSFKVEISSVAAEYYMLAYVFIMQYMKIPPGVRLYITYNQLERRILGIWGLAYDSFINPFMDLIWTLS